MALATPGNTPSRGIQNHSGGAFDESMKQDLVDGDALQGPITKLLGVADVINPHIAGNYIISTGQVDAITLGLPTPGVDDGLSIDIVSDTAFAHTVTLPSAGYAVGTATPKTVATFTAQRGAGMFLRAFNGLWQVIGNISNTAGSVSATFT